MSLLKVEHVSKRYGMNETEVNALNDISFEVEQGEFISIIGASGSGKSTLLHILGGVDQPTSGRVYIGDTDLYTLDETSLAIFRRRQIGLIYQFYNLIPILTVEENMTLPMLLDRRSVSSKQVEHLLSLLQLTDRRTHLPNQLSGGQQQRAAIGRALISNPSIVLADEPTGNLDQKNSAQILALLKQMHHDYNQTLIMITHDEDIALQADRMIQLVDGRIVRDEVIRSCE